MVQGRAERRAVPPARGWLAGLAWALAWAGMLLLDGRTELANQALLLVLGAALAAVWLGPWTALLSGVAAVLLFNLAFVPPRGTFSVDLRQHALLLLTLVSVSALVALLVSRLRWHVAQADAHARRTDALRELGEALRAADEPAAQAASLQQALVGANAHSSVVLLADRGPNATSPLSGPKATAAALQPLGPVDADEATGLRLCLQEGRAMGPGTGRHEALAAWYLPLRGRAGTQGAALVRLTEVPRQPDAALAHAQALCDQAGAALERSNALQAAGAAREQAQAEALRNTLLAAVAHDHRTPLATILGAAGALHDQGERLTPAQRTRLAATIVDEATQLARLTDNTLQLARLDGLGLALQRDWESVEELVGSVLHRIRQRDPTHRVKARLASGLPLLRCDAVLIVQLLDNLVDNALEHGGATAPVEVVARQVGEQLVLAVCDRGPGVPAAWGERVFERFVRGADVADGAPGTGSQRRGAGVGLALCRAIARAHGGELRLHRRHRGGSRFELVLPVETPPAGPPLPDPPEAGPGPQGSAP